MSQNSLFNIEFDFQPDTVRLLPEGPIQVRVTPHYRADGVLDLEYMLAQLLAGIEAKMGKIQAISPEGREDLKKQIAQKRYQRQHSHGLGRAERLSRRR